MSVVHGRFIGQWIRHASSVSLYAISSWIGIWNRLVTPSINGKEGMDGGDEGESSKEENGGREWFSAAAMKVDRGLAVGL